MPAHLLRLEHRQQEVPAGCLAACTQMALANLGITVTQAKLNRLLGLTPVGVPASHLRRLERYGVQASFQQGTADDLQRALEQDTPPIVFVRTGQLSYWTTDTQHAVLISGYDEMTFLLNDPAFPTTRRVEIFELVLAWDEFDNRYALITR